MTRMVFATDGSPGAQNALRLLINMGLRPADVVEVVTVAEHPPRAEPHLDPADLRAAGIAADAVQRLRAAGIAAIAEPAEGAPAPAIADVVLRTRADMVVVGSRGLGRWMAVMFGSIARALTHPAPAPVLVVRGQPVPPRRVLLAAVDLVAVGRGARALAHLPLPSDVTVEVVFPAQNGTSAQPWSPRLVDVFEEARRVLPGVDVRVHAAGPGSFAAAILAQAEKTPADLVVVPMERGAEGDGTVDEVLGSSRCSVLVVPAPVAMVQEHAAAAELQPALP